MTDYFCDTTLTTGANDGTSMDDAWQSIKTAFESTVPAGGDIVWIRRASSFSSPTSNIEPTRSGIATDPQFIIGWPRNTHSITSSDWTNGSTAVVVDDANMVKGQHCGRWITAPDGNRYLITRVVDASNIVIDRKYIGSTVTNQGATIHADEDYDLAQAIDDTGWTITKSNWNADADDLPVVDFGANEYNLYLNGSNYWAIKNFDLRGSTDAYGTVWLRAVYEVFLQGCLVTKSENSELINCYGGHSYKIDRCILVGGGTGAGQQGLIVGYPGDVSVINSAIYNCGDVGLYAKSTVFLDNVNIGVEQSNADNDIYYYGRINGKDVALGGANGMVAANTSLGPQMSVDIENFQKELGAHRRYNNAGSAIKTDVVSGSGDPYKRTDGADSVIALSWPYSPSRAGYSEWAFEVLKHEFVADTTSKSYRYYVQADLVALSADDIWLECEYVSAYSGTTKYMYTKVKSDEAIAQRTGADDWSQYVEVTGIQPAVGSTVRITLYITFYDTDGTVYVDPLPMVS